VGEFLVIKGPNVVHVKRNALFETKFHALKNGRVQEKVPIAKQILFPNIANILLIHSYHLQHYNQKYTPHSQDYVFSWVSLHGERLKFSLIRNVSLANHDS